eukprot:COSAG02_NODE_12927_length_1471_cov_1.422012_1_plen_326_part_00
MEGVAGGVAAAEASRRTATQADTLIPVTAIRTITHDTRWEGPGCWGHRLGRITTTHLAHGDPALDRQDFGQDPSIPRGCHSTHSGCHRGTPMVCLGLPPPHRRRWEALTRRQPPSPHRGRPGRPRSAHCGIGCERRKHKRRKGALKLRRLRKRQRRRRKQHHAAMDTTVIGVDPTTDVLQGSGGIETTIAAAGAATEEGKTSASVTARPENGGRRSKSFGTSSARLSVRSKTCETGHDDSDELRLSAVVGSSNQRGCVHRGCSRYQAGAECFCLACAHLVNDTLEHVRASVCAGLKWEYEIYDTRVFDYCMTLLIEVLIWRTAAC